MLQSLEELVEGVSTTPSNAPDFPDYDIETSHFGDSLVVTFGGVIAAHNPNNFTRVAIYVTTDDDAEFLGKFVFVITNIAPPGGGYFSVVIAHIGFNLSVNLHIVAEKD